ncbi:MULTISPECIES: S9 family peptidase [unclassified Flavobacterium]|uniref:S9 family peptidase n=1 Tax=unclassified Flavobacterium TaxID=196869 RepID=UPI00086E4B58|nr:MULTISPECIES: S9 family peptidase [unclassified Flavobacterium]MBN9283481.1 S9 family peptidase [Flavobacterium sp.]ODS86230.1 MAG: peptidase S9 [Chryseobacterium sp. SCN 40-13]OJV69398.1 MAG: S9 family peptidase [Flavobacterium sp. 40-81]
MKKLLILTLGMMGLTAAAQETLTPDLLWKLGRLSPIGISKDGKNIVYKVATPSIEENKSNAKYYTIPVNGGVATEVPDVKDLVADKNLSPDGKYILSHKEVKVSRVLGKDFYPELKKSEAQIYNELDYRHWDTWNDGTHNHVFYAENADKAKAIDIMKDEPYDSPQKPFGGDEDYIWSHDGSKIIYVSKKQYGTNYAISTNTDLYEYDINTKKTRNLTDENMGYDTHPMLSPNGDLTWLQMKRDGYEADKNDIIVRHKEKDINLTAAWDGTVDSFKWSADGKKVYFIAAVDGTKQLFEVNFPGLTKIAVRVTQITNGDFDVSELIGVSGNNAIVTRTDMNHAPEIYAYDLKKKTWKQLTTVNNDLYGKLTLGKTERRYVTTTDGKKMLVWVILPPNFDKTKKYPTLLYCQGGPQSALTQSYSFRWNFSLMASQGYIIVAPNRRGMPGHGVQWNEQISKDWGGQVMDDYLSAIDDMAKEPYVDKTRLGAVGASYGGYSVFYLAGIHKNRFKTFISHCGVYNLESMYGTTEEVFFNNWDHGGPYWQENNVVAQKAYNQFNPIKLVNNWNTPIMIIQGGKDYRVPIGQGQEAFQAAQLKGIKSRFMYFPEENHWVTKPQNALVWQREFFKWLKETL